MAQAAPEAWPPRLRARARSWPGGQPPSPAGIPATATPAALDEALPGPRRGPSEQERRALHAVTERAPSANA